MSDVTTRLATRRGTRTVALPGRVRPPGMASSVC